MGKMGKRLLLIVLISWCSIAYAQLDTIHYVPPLFASDHNWTYPGDQAVYVSTPSSNNVNYTISDGAGNVLKSGTVSNSSPEKYTCSGFGTDFVVDENDLHKVLTDRGFKVTADEAVYVNIRARSSNGSQGTSLTCKGQAGFGTGFRIGHYPSPQSSNDNKASSFGIMATENGTTVEVDLTDNPVTLRGGLAPNTNSVITISLNKGETYVFGMENPDGANNPIKGMIGGKVTSDKPVVINTGSWGGNLENGNSTDVGIDQIVGVDNIGKEYVVVRGQSSSDKHEKVMVVAEYDNTAIYLNGSGVAAATINAGDYHLINGSEFVNEVMYIETSKNSYTYQFMMGSTSTSYNTQGMNFIPPITCGSANSVDNIPEIEKIANTTYGGGVTVVTMKGSIVLVNGQVPAVAPVEAVGSNYEAYKILGLTGDVSVSSNTIALVGFFGSSGAAGYGGYYSGFDGIQVELDWVCAPGYAEELTKRYDSYQWFKEDVILPGETKDSLYITEPGNYSLEYRLGTCVDTSTYYVVPEPSDVLPSGTAKFCEGESVTLSVLNTDIDSVFWFDGIENSTVVNQTGTYLVTARDTTGCLLTDSISVEKFQYPSVDVVAVPDSICSGSVSRVTGTSDADSVYWGHGPSGNSFDVSSGGEYILFGVNGSTCIKSDTINVVEINSPTVSIDGNDTTICEGTSITINVNGDFDNVIWNDANTSTSRTLSFTGEYIVTAYKSGLCTIKDTFNLVVANNPSPTIVSTVPHICKDSVIGLSLSSSYNQYLWSTTSNAANISIGDSSLYWVEVTDANGCIGRDSGKYSIIEPETVSLNDGIICAGDSFTFNPVTNASVFKWQDNSTGSNFIAMNAGVYSVEITDANLCKAIATANLTVNALPSFTIGDQSICEGDAAVNFSPSIDGDNYKWNSGEEVKIISKNTAGTYILELTNSNGCVGTDSATLTVNQNPKIVFDNSLSKFCENASSVQLSATPVGGDWLLNGNSFNGLLELNNLNADNIITYSYTDVNSCSSIDSFALGVSDTTELLVSNLDDLCMNEESYTLQINVTGGVWTLNDVIFDGVIDPSHLHKGRQEIKYVYQNADLCTSEFTADLDIFDTIAPVVTPINDFCNSVGSFELSGTPSGGDWLIDDQVVGSEIEQSDYTEGTYEVEYKVTSQDACVSDAKASFRVFDIPSLSLTPISPLCVSDDNVALSATPINGVWKLNDLIVSSVDPSVVGEGTHTYVYEFDNGSCTERDSINVVINGLPVFNEIDDQAICAGESVSFDVSSWINSNPGSVLEWMDGSTELNFSADVTEDTIVWAKVIDLNGCEKRDTAFIKVWDTLNLVVSGMNAGCAGEVITLSSNYSNDADVSFDWGDGNTNGSLSVDSTGTYKLTIEDKHGCSYSDTILLEFEELPDYYLDGDTICGTSGGDIGLILADGDYENYEIEWSNGEKEPAIYITEEGWYSVEVINKETGCNKIDSSYFKINTIPSFKLPNDASICEGNFVSLFSDTDYPNGSYEWNNGHQGTTYDANESGTYSLTITNDFCSYTDKFVLIVHDFPKINFGPDTNVCEQIGLTLSVASGYTSYLWSDSSTANTLLVDTSGSYSVQVNNNGCLGQDAINVTVYSNPEYEWESNWSICEDEIYVVNIPGFESYQWSDGDSVATKTFDSTGSYSVVVQNLAGCSTVSTINLIVSEYPKFSLPNDTLICEGDTFNINLETSFDFNAWNDVEQKNSEIQITEAGTYVFKAMNNPSCSKMDTIIINRIDLPSNFLGADTSVCFREVDGLELSSSYPRATAYNWSTGESTNSISVDSVGEYILTMTIANLCPVSDTIEVESDCIFSIYVPNAFSPNDDGLNETFGVKGNNIDGFYFEIYDRWGEILFTSYDMYDSWDGRYKGNLVKQDVYVWKLKYDYYLDSGRKIQKLKFGTVTVIR